jgi:hypothetical protein
MQNMISKYFPAALALESKKPARDLITLTENDAIFHLALAKERRRKQLRSKFQNNIKSQQKIKVFITDDRLRNISVKDHQYVKFSLSKTEIALGGDQLLSGLDGAIVFLTNADADTEETQDAYSRLYDSCPNTIFIGWDTSNSQFKISSKCGGV